MRNWKNLFSLVLIGGALTVTLSGQATADHRPTVSIGYISQTVYGVEDNPVGSTIEYLQDKLKERYRFKMVRLTSSNLIEDIKNQKPNFIIVPSEYFIQVTSEAGLGAHDIAVRKTIFSTDASRSIGSVFITTFGRNDLNTVESLKGKSIATADTDTVGDWWAALGEIKNRGFNPEQFFGKVNLSPFFFTGVVEEVLSGKSDAGILPTCALELMQGEGLLSPNSIKVIDPVKPNTGNKDFFCLRSTQNLYPGTVMASMQHTPDAVVKQVAIALFTMPATSKSEWAVSNDFSEMLALMKELKFGMFSTLRDYSFTTIVKRYSTEIIFVLLVLFLLFLNEVRIHRLVDKRTFELSSALRAKEKAEKEAIEGRKRLSHIERSGVISQMSNIIAHELKQPLGALINYAAVLKLKEKKQQLGDALTTTIVSNIDSEAKRIAAIVDSVRKFAKKEQAPKIPCDLLAITRKAIRTYQQQEDPDIIIPLETQFTQAPVTADPLSLELLILNVIRNGASASKTDSGVASVGIKLSLENSKWLLSISNEGNELTDEQLARLSIMGESVKPEGLGLGLSIVREIADYHSASLVFEKRPGGGITAEIAMDKRDD